MLLIVFVHPSPVLAFVTEFFSFCPWLFALPVFLSHPQAVFLFVSASASVCLISLHLLLCFLFGLCFISPCFSIFLLSPCISLAASLFCMCVRIYTLLFQFLLLWVPPHPVAPRSLAPVHIYLGTVLPGWHPSRMLILHRFSREAQSWDLWY